MLTDIVHILDQEVSLFQAALETELEKRDAILSASGRKLQVLTAKTEILVKEIQKLEEKRTEIAQMFARLYGLKRADLSGIISMADEMKLNGRDELEKMAETYREAAGLLQSEVRENSVLLTKTGERLNRVVDSLKSLISGESKTYGPKTKTNRKSSGSLILNANA